MAVRIILLVEDSEDDVFLMRHAVQKAGAEVELHVAWNGQEAIDYLSGAGAFSDRTTFPLPTAVILDLMLPQVHGLEVLRWMKEESPHGNVPVAVLSASVEAKHQSQALALGATGLWMKPSSPELVRELLATM